MLATSGLITARNPIFVTSPTKTSDLAPQAVTISVNKAYPLKGSEKIALHAYSYLRVSPYCSRTVAISLQSPLACPQTLIVLRNRAMVTGANTLLIADWHEQSGFTTVTAHFFNCSSRRALQALVDIQMCRENHIFDKLNYHVACYPSIVELMFLT